MNKGKILAIDYGTKKIGLAVSDDAGLLPFGRGVIDRSKGGEHLLKTLRDLCLKEGVVELVIGMPFYEGAIDEQRPEIRRVRNFAAKLGLQFPELKINFVDESFSSFEAQKIQQAARYHGQDDEQAAMVILQRYLDKP